MIFNLLPSEQPPTTAEERGWRRRQLRRLRELVKEPARRHRFLFFSGMMTLGAVSTMAYLTYRFQHLPLDLRVSMGLQGIRFYPFAKVMTFISLAGYRPWSLLVIGTGVVLAGRGLGWQHGAYLAGVTAFEGLVNRIIKAAIGRPRPAESLVEVLLPHTEASFPSGHVMFYTVYFGFLFFLIWTQVRRSLWRTILLLALSLMILLVGPSRIYLGAHWFSDVVAGHLVGLIILLFALEFYLQYVVHPRANAVANHSTQ